MKKRFFTLLCLCVLSLVLCGFSVPSKNGFVDDLERNVADLEQTSTFQDLKLQWDSRLETQQKFEKEVNRIIRVQDDLERSAVLGVQNLSNKKKLTKEERKRFLSIYKEMPKTVEEYEEMSKDIKRSERKVESPQKVHDEKFEKLPDPRYLLKKYNKPAGDQNLDLRNLLSNRELTSIGVASPQLDKMAYTKIYYSGYNDKVYSELYYIDLDVTKSPKNRIKTASFMNKKQIKLMDSAWNEEYPSLFKSLTIVDWSADATKLALKEKVGSSIFGIWQTNLWVYDLTDNSTKCLWEVREAVKYHVMKNQNIDIDDYRWDIIPMGWDANNPERILVCAYAVTKKKSTKFLGVYSVDSRGENTQLISDKPMAINTSANGLVLKAVYD